MASLPNLDAPDRPTPLALDIRLLGPVEVWRGGQPRTLGGRRQRTLLALLAIEPGRTVAVDRLIDLMWAGDPPAGAATTLKVYASRLRSTLGEPADLANVQSGYRLQVPPESIDAVRFERRLDAARQHLHRRAPRAAALAREALDLWRGPAFGGLAEGGVLRARADQLEQLRLEATELRIEAELAMGGSAELVAELEALVAEHPFRERLWRHLMLALYRAGRQADALAAYHRAHRALDEELGVEPGPELAGLEAAILRHEVPGPVTSPATDNLPAPLTTFIGRHVELEDISRLLREMRLVTLTGVGGVGKTRLALEAARAALPQQADGAWFIDLAPVSIGELVASEVAAALNVPEQGPQDATGRLVEHLRDHEAVIVLDNCEHVLEASADIAARVLKRCAGLRILATSRVPLGVEGEAVFTVPPLSTKPDPERGGRSEAVDLLLARARAARPRLTLTAEEAMAAARICADLDGLPLAIELAAARVRALSLGDIAGRLEDRLRFLVSWRRLASARHRTMSEALDWSYDLLGPSDQRLFRELSVFSGGFTLDAVAAVCLDGDEVQAVNLVERLVDASLLTADHRGDGMRYDMLEIVREYARERLAATDDGELLRKRHAAYFLGLAEGPAELVERELSLGPLARLDPDRRNLRSALADLESAGDAEGVLRLAAALWRYWWLRGALVEGRASLELALAGTAAVRSPIRGRALRGASTLASRQGDAAAAERYAIEAVELSRAIGDEAGLAQGLMAVGNALIDHGDYHRAAEEYEAAAVILRKGGPTRDLAVLLLNRGSLALNLGELAVAEQAANDSLALARGASDDAGISVNLTTLGMVALQRGDPERARVLLDEALTRAAGLGAVEWLMSALVVNAATELELGRPEQAAEDLGLADRLRDEIGATLDGVALQDVDRRLRIGAEAALGPEAFADRLARGRAREISSRLQALEIPTPGRGPG